MASRGSAPPGRRCGRVRHRHVVPGLQGRHRDGVPRGRRAHGRGAADDELRRARGAGRGRRAGRAAAARAREDRQKPAGSCIGIVVTDAPVDGASCARLARRVGLGLARAGSVAHHGSGEIFMAFGTGMRLDRDGKPDGTPVVTGRALDPLFTAVVEAAEEAVLNSMFSAPTVTGRDGNTSESAYNDEVLRLLPMRVEEERIPVRDGAGWRRRCTCPTSRPGRSRALSRRCPTARTTSPRPTPRPTAACASSTGTPCAGSTCAAPDRRRATRWTSTRRPSSATCPTPSAGSRPRTGATVRSGCGARRTPASTPCRSRASDRRSSRRSARSSPPTTGGPTTCTGAAARCGSSISSTTATT